MKLARHYTESYKGFERKLFSVFLILKNHRFLKIPTYLLRKPLHVVLIWKHRLKTSRRHTRFTKLCRMSNQSTIIFIIFWDSLMFYQIFLSPQVKRCAINTYNHGIYGLPHELPNDLRLRKVIPTAFSPLGWLWPHKKKKDLGKCLNFIEW